MFKAIFHTGTFDGNYKPQLNKKQLIKSLLQSLQILYIFCSNSYGLLFLNFDMVKLILSCIMLKNSQTYLNNLVVFTPQDFQSTFGHFSSLYA